MCRPCGPVGQVGEGVCPKATSGSRAARCDRLGAEREGERPPCWRATSHCGVSRSWPPMPNKMTVPRVGVPPPCSGALVSFPHRTREAGRVGPPVPGRPAPPRVSQGWGVVASSSCLPHPPNLPASFPWSQAASGFTAVEVGRPECDSVLTMSCVLEISPNKKLRK